MRSLDGRGYLILLLSEAYSKTGYHSRDVAEEEIYGVLPKKRNVNSGQMAFRFPLITEDALLEVGISIVRRKNGESILNYAGKGKIPCTEIKSVDLLLKM